MDVNSEAVIRKMVNRKLKKKKELIKETNIMKEHKRTKCVTDQRYSSYKIQSEKKKDKLNETFTFI